jgi:uncharacterized membrane protein YedE/YeeE
VNLSSVLSIEHGFVLTYERKMQHVSSQAIRSEGRRQLLLSFGASAVFTLFLLVALASVTAHLAGQQVRGQSDNVMRGQVIANLAESVGVGVLLGTMEQRNNYITDLKPQRNSIDYQRASLLLVGLWERTGYQTSHASLFFIA